MTPTETLFAGLDALAPGDPFSSNGYKFQSLDRFIIARILQVGAITHKHDAHAACPDPTLPIVLSTSSTGGAIPSATPLFVAYTLVDADGGESLPVAAATLTTPAGYSDPFDVPTAVVDYLAGTLLGGNYSYAVTVTDGLGGESGLSPAALVAVAPGNPNAEVAISGLTALTDDASGGASGAGWRLWRSQGGASWYLIGSGTRTDDTFTDDGIAGDCSVAPPESNSTVGANSLSVTVPGGQPAAAVSFRVYASPDGSFTSPAFMGLYPTAPGDTVITYTDLVPTLGAPPTVSTCLPGANQIDPDTDILAWTWKRPVANFAALPSSGNTLADARVTEDTMAVYLWNGTAWVLPPGGSPSGAAGGDLSGSFPNPTVIKASGAFTVAGNVGFYGHAAVARPTGYTLTYATKSRTLAADTAANVATTASTNTSPYGYTTAAQADAIVAAVNAIRVDLDNTKNVLAQLIADLQSNGLLQ